MGKKKNINSFLMDSEYELMKYKLANDALGIALWDMNVVNEDPINPKNKFTWSQEFRHMLGFNDENDFPDLFLSWSGRLHPEDQEYTLNALAAHLNDHTGKTPYNLEYRLMTKSGDYRYFHAFGTTLRDDSGIPLRVAGALMDIDEKKRTQNQLKIMSSIVQHSPNFISYKKLCGECLYVNPAATLLTGYTDDELKKDYLSSLFDDETVTNISAKVTKDLKESGISWYEAKGKIKGDSERIFKGTSFLVEKDAFATVAEDVTVTRKIEYERIEALKALEYSKKLTDTLNMAAITFLSKSGNTFGDMMTSGLKPFCEALDLDRVSVWRNFYKPEGLYGSQIYRWDRVSGGTTKPTKGLDNLAYAELAPRWEGLLAAGKSINSPVSLLPEAAILKSFGVVSSFITPVFINDVFWGFVLFEDRRKERYFDSESADVMRSAAFLCANTVVQKEKEQALTFQAHWYKSILNAIPLPVTVTDVNMNWTFVNKAVEEFLGTKQEDMLGKPCSNWNAHICKTPDCGIACAKRGEKRTFFTHNGLSYQVDVEILKDADEGNAGFIEVVQDITKIKEAEIIKQARIVDEHIQIMFDSMPLCANYWTKDYKMAYCNEESVRLFGLADKQEFISRFNELSPPFQPDGRPSGETVEILIKKAFKEGYCRCEWMMQKLNGEPIPVDVALVRVSHGDDYIVVAYFRDLRELKMLLNKIHNEKEKYKTMAHWYESLLDAIPFLVSAQDTEEKWTFVNSSAEIFLKKKREEITGVPCKNWGLSICNTDECAIVCAKRGKMRTFFSHENTSYQIDTKLLKDLKGEDAGYIEIIQDVTQIESMMKHQAEMEAASKAKSSFLAAMSHEMRTPMNSIIGMSTIGKNAGDLEGKNNALDKIIESSTYLLGVINDVLDMSKIESNKLELANVSFDLNASINKAVSLIQFSIDEKRFKFSLKLDDTMPCYFIGDDQRLTQVITNLLANAVKFTPDEGSISLSVSLIQEKDGICELRFEVADTGIGISPKYHEKIFDSFEQAEKGTTRKYGGTGLGLVISKSIIELMGGRIWVESKLGKGSQFIFTVKLSRDLQKSHLQSDFKDKEEVSIEDIYNNFKGKRVLLAEDIEINREILVTLLDGTGLIIDTAENGVEAVEMVRADPDKYHLIFMDMQMPVMDGLEATRQIRALPAVCDRMLPIIAMTANVFQDDIAKCRAAGMDDHIGKPINLSNVLGKLSYYLSMQS